MKKYLGLTSVMIVLFYLFILDRRRSWWSTVHPSPSPSREFQFDAIRILCQFSNWLWRIQDFPKVGRQSSRKSHPSRRRRQHTILPDFPENCMKLKEFGPREDRSCPNFYYVDPPLTSCVKLEQVVILKSH